MPTIRNRLSKLGMTIPDANPTVFAYQPAIRHGNLILIAGQIPKINKDTLAFTGQVGSTVLEQEARLAVQTCVLNALAWIDELTRADGAEVAQILRVNYFFQVPATPLLSLSKLADAGSLLLTNVFGDKGRHPRSVIGVTELPRNSPVLIDMDVALTAPSHRPSGAKQATP